MAGHFFYSIGNHPAFFSPFSAALLSPHLLCPCINLLLSGSDVSPGRLTHFLDYFIDLPLVPFP